MLPLVNKDRSHCVGPGVEESFHGGICSYTEIAWWANMFWRAMRVGGL